MKKIGYTLTFLALLISCVMLFDPKLVAEIQIRGSQILSHTVTITQLDAPITGATRGDSTHYPIITYGNDGRLTSTSAQAWSHNLLSAQHSDTTAASGTKGDLIGTDGSTWQRFAVGSDTQVLTADSTQPLGFKWAAGGGGGGGATYNGAWQVIGKIVTSGSASSVDFSSIPSTYSALAVRFSASELQSGTNSTTMYVKLNGDNTAANYVGSFRYGSQNAAIFSTTQAPVTSQGIQVGYLPQSGNTNMNGTGMLELQDYTNTSYHKRFTGSAFDDDGTTNGTEWTYNARWKNTAAVNELTFSTSGTGFANGSTFILYGLSSVSGGATAAGGVFTLVEAHTASSSTEVDFTQISSTYDEYLFEFENVLPATNSVGLQMQVSTNGGSSYDTGSNYRYANYLVNDTGSFSTNSVASSSATSIILASSTLNNTSANGGVSGWIKLFNPGNASQHKNITGQTTSLYADGNWYTAMTGGAYKSTTAVNAVRFLMSSGNVASGTIRMYGISNVTGAGAGAAGKVLLEQHTASSSAQLDFDSCISSSYDTYEFSFVSVIPATTGQTINLRFSTDGGATFDTGNNYRHQYTFSNSNNTGGTSGSNSESALVFMGGITNVTADGGGSGSLTLFNPGLATGARYVEFSSGFRFTDTNYYHIHGSGTWVNSTTAANAVRFLSSSGNIASGTIRCYGIAK